MVFVSYWSLRRMPFRITITGFLKHRFVCFPVVVVGFACFPVLSWLFLAFFVGYATLYYCWSVFLHSDQNEFREMEVKDEDHREERKVGFGEKVEIRDGFVSDCGDSTILLSDQVGFRQSEEVLQREVKKDSPDLLTVKLAGCLPEEDDSCSPEEWREGSVSDNESLIEIVIRDDLSMRSSAAKELPESYSRRRRLVELFAELMEEENLIEIDLRFGSIKCPTVQIEA